jgi:M6 family metalloprotease-like protein
LRGYSLALRIVTLVSLAGGLATTASGQLVVRRLPQPATTAKATQGVPQRDDAKRRNAFPAARTRLSLPPPLMPVGPNAGPEAWRRVMEVRAQRDRAFPHRLSRPGVDWSPHANRRRGWVAPGGPLRDPSARGTSAAASVASVAAVGPPDTIHIAFIRIDYRHDRGGDLSSGNGRFDLSGPDTTRAPIDRPPHNRAFYLSHLEALRRYYDAQSYGRVVIVGDVWPRTPDGAYSLNDMADFGPWVFSQEIYGAAVDYFRAAFFAADSQSSTLYADRIPWDDYDRFMLIHAGADFQSDLRQDSPEDMPTFTLGVRSQDKVIFPDSLHRPIDRACIVPETASQDGFYEAINGLVAHENGHNCFGFADLYDVFTGRPVVGYWSLMDSGNLVGAPFQLPDGSESFAVGLLPPSVDPFHRFFAGDALTFTDVAWGDTMTIADGERNPDMRRVFLSSDEYLLLENRAIAAADSVLLDQDTTTRVVLGPKKPDRFEYDALLPSLWHEEGTPPPPSGGILVWHIDASNIPFETALRIDPAQDYGFNSGPGPPAITVVEADGLGDLGDLGSPFLFASAYDPYFRSNNRTLGDATTPNLKPRTGTRPHMQLDFLDDPDTLMRFSAVRDWQLDGWPIAADFPPGGPLLLTVDADGAPDRQLEVCWAGGPPGRRDSTALFAVRVDGTGLFPDTLAFAHLDRRPRPLMAALPIGAATQDPPDGPSYFAVSTYYDPSADSLGGVPGGRVWLIDHLGAPLPGWPAALPSIVTTPPVIAGAYPNATVFVGCANGHVYELQLDGAIRRDLGPTFLGEVSGRLAVWRDPTSGASLVAAGSADGEVAVLDASGTLPPGYLSRWPMRLGSGGFAPDFLWLDFDGNGQPTGATSTCGADVPELIVHQADHLWAFCVSGTPLPGWGRSYGDTLVAGLGAGDPDGDGYAEVLTQSVGSQLAFINQSGHPSPGWPRAATREGLRTDSPALALDVDGDRRAEVVALDASGILAALRGDGRVPDGWPLATGVGAIGSPAAADLDRDGRLEIVAPDRAVAESLQVDINGRFGTLYAYSLEPQPVDPTVSSWPMLGGDPGRTSSLPAARTATAPPTAAGPLEGGSLHAFPNPARRRPVSFAYRLTEPADVDFTILDTSGHEVASFTRPGRRSDNLEIWDPGPVPAGLYVARLRFRGASSTHSEVITLGLLR